MARAVRRWRVLFQKGLGDRLEGVGRADAIGFPLGRDLDRGIDAALDQGDPVARGVARLLQRDRRIGADRAPGRILRPG